MDISGYEINSLMYWKQLNILKRACDVSFNGLSTYSKEFLSVLNRNREKEQQKQPLNFTIKMDEKLKFVVLNKILYGERNRFIN